ncbi:MAG: hypothetical protein ACOC12_06100 [Bacteroidota bacterium]
MENLSDRGKFSLWDMAVQPVIALCRGLLAALCKKQELRLVELQTQTRLEHQLFEKGSGRGYQSNYISL